MPDQPKSFIYPGGRRIVAGRRYDTDELARMGLLPPEMAETHGAGGTFSTVTDVNHKTRTVTFDTPSPKRRKGRR